MARFYMIRRGRFANKAIQSFADIIEKPESFFCKDLKDAFTVWKNEPLIQMYFYPITGIKNTVEMLALKRQKERVMARSTLELQSSQVSYKSRHTNERR